MLCTYLFLFYIVRNGLQKKRLSGTIYIMSVHVYITISNVCHDSNNIFYISAPPNLNFARLAV